MLDLNKPETVPVGTRVFHFHGGDNTHGRGTIIEVRTGQAIPKDMLEKTAEVLDEQNLSEEGKAIIAGGVVNSFYDPVRCPYRVKWDKNPVFFDRHPDLNTRFPDGQYIDVYEPDSLKLV